MESGGESVMQNLECGMWNLECEGEGDVKCAKRSVSFSPNPQILTPKSCFKHTVTKKEYTKEY